MFQAAFRAAMPILPYREPKIVPFCADLGAVLQREGARSVLIVTDAVIMPCVLEAYGDSVHKKLHRLGVAAGVCREDDTHEAGAVKFIEAVKRLNAAMNIPSKIEGIRKEDIPEMAALAEKESNPLYPVPKLMTKKELEQICYMIGE